MKKEFELDKWFPNVSRDNFILVGDKVLKLRTIDEFICRHYTRSGYQTYYLLTILNKKDYESEITIRYLHKNKNIRITKNSSEDMLQKITEKDIINSIIAAGLYEEITLEDIY